MDPNAIDKAPDAAAAWPDQIYDLLKKHEIRQVCLVPDAGHSRLIKRCLADNEIKVTTLTTEEEGIARQGHVAGTEAGLASIRFAWKDERRHRLCGG